MYISLSRPFKILAMAFAFAAVLGLGQSEARADEFVISGFTQGCLCPNPNGVPQPSTTGGLTYSNESFNALTVNGNFTGLGLGNFALASSANLGDLSVEQFSLLITFNAPLGIGGNPFPISTLITGRVDATPDGLIIDFDNNPFTFNFANSSAFGTFQLVLSDSFIEAGGVGSISGGFLNASLTPIPPNPIPEPATLVLLATGLVGAAGAARRRRRGPG